jgi:enamine deaminase RidA (YjgF/YER057c/UK114 family)
MRFAGRNGRDFFKSFDHRNHSWGQGSAVGMGSLPNRMAVEIEAILLGHG